jgi:hypothetical protein
MAEANGNGAAGTIELDVVMTNQAAGPCTLIGYPGMQLLGPNNAPLPTNVLRGGGPRFPNPAANATPTLVTVASGASAQFSLSYSDVPVGTETHCPTSQTTEVTPPNDTAYAVVPLQITACGGGTIHVSPVYASS